MSVHNLSDSITEEDLPKLANQHESPSIKQYKKIFFIPVFVLPLFIIPIGISLINLIFIPIPSEIKSNETQIKEIIVNNYNKKEDLVTISVVSTKKQKFCAITETKIENPELLEYQETINDYCELEILRKPYYIYFKNKDGIISEALEINNYLIDINIDDKYFVTPGTPVDLGNNIIQVGDIDITWSNLELESEIPIDNNIYNNEEEKKMTLIALWEGRQVASTTIYTTNLITNIPNEYNMQKPYLACKQYTQEEAEILDEILYDRINKAGEKTRAGVVAAARFLTLEFPYRIAYYHETGRMSKTGKRIVDGEGRYSKKGLYLDESKYKDIQASFFGPAIWGCKMISYEDDPPYFKPGVMYPNGFDCSGFVTWTIINGGFDIGDYGAGQSEGKWDLTDYGDVRPLTSSIIESDIIKVGDLFNIWGHIAILVGKTDSHYYIAESLQPYGGVVVRKYSKKTVNNSFSYVVLMDKLYEQYGALTNMW